MKKILTVFQSNDDGLVRNEITPGAEWVLQGEGTPSRKFAGKTGLMKDGRLYKPHVVEAGKAAPKDYIPPADEDDPTGWVPVGDGPEDASYREALANMLEGPRKPLPDGVVEIIGVDVANRHGEREWGTTQTTFAYHGQHKLDMPPRRTFETIRAYLAVQDIDGIVWWHADGRRAKITRRDFGLPPRPKHEKPPAP